MPRSTLRSNEPQIRYLLLADIGLLDYLKGRQEGYGSALTFQLANALFQTADRFDELIRLTWGDCQAIGKEIVDLRINERGASSTMYSWEEHLSAAPLRNALCEVVTE